MLTEEEFIRAAQNIVTDTATNIDYELGLALTAPQKRELLKLINTAVEDTLSLAVKKLKEE